MKMGNRVRKSGGSTHRVTVCALTLMLVALADVSGIGASASAQQPYSSYIPNAVPTATSTLFTNGTTSIAPGRVAVDKAGNAFFIGHVSGLPSTLYEIPAASPVVTVSTPTPLINGLGQTNSNSAFVDAAGTLWVSNGNGLGAALIEIPASNGIPNTAAITGSSNYNSGGLSLINVSTACTAAPTAPCVWTAGSIGTSLTSLQIGDVYSDGNGNVYLVDVSDSVSAGAYNRVIQFNTSSAGTTTVVSDKLTSNSYAQVTLAGDGNVYYCDSVTGNSTGGVVSAIISGALTTVGNLPSASLTLLNGIVKVTAATGITTDPWGNLIISGPKQLSEVPLESGTPNVLNFADQFNLIIAITGANAPMATNNVTYGGTFDVHGSYYYASATNIMQVQVGGYNFGKVNVGTEITTAAPFFTITWDIPSQLVSSGIFPTASPATLSAANAAYLQSFPNGNNKNFFGGTPYSASITGQYLLMYFQPVHAGLLRGADSPQGYANALASTDPGGATLGATEYGTNGAYVVNLQGVGVGPQPMFLPGTASQPVPLSQLYTTPSHTTKAAGFIPTSVAVDTYGDIFAVDNANSSLDVACLATTSSTATGNSEYCQANAGHTFKVGYTLNKTVISTSFVTPVDVVLDGANNVYVLDSGSGTPTVTKFGYNTMIPSVVVPSGISIAGSSLSNPQGLGIDGYSNLYISDTGNNRILQGRQYNAAYSQNIVYVPSTVKFGGVGLSGPTGLGLDASGNLFIADSGNKRIVEYSATGVASVVSMTGVTLASPTGVKVLPSGALVIADSTLGLVLVDNGVGSLLTTGSFPLSSTQGLGLDLAGNIYVADPAGAQVVELNVSAPATATAFPLTYRGRDSSTETSFVYNSGNASLNISAVPTVTDVTTPAANEFSVNSGNGCTTGVQLAPALNCSMIMNFTPAATADVYNPTIGAATLADNLQSYTVSSGIGVFGTTGSTQTVTLTGQATTTLTPQTITFTTPITSVTWSASIPPFTLSATGGPTGNPVVFSIRSGQGTLSGTNNNTLTVTNIGTTVIAANQAGALVNGIYYGAAAQATQQIVVNPIGIVATPTFSVAAGTYTAVQSVTISDATSGATIYYTTNGNTPTVSSPVYTGTAIPVNVTTTIKAFAVGAPGFSSSPVATATYTLNPDFILTPAVTNFNVPNGLGGSATLTLTPLFGFTGNVVLSCSGLYSSDTCSFLSYVKSNGNQSTVPTNTLTILPNTTDTVFGVLIVQANETASLAPSERRTFAPVAVLAIVLFFGGFRKRRRLVTAMLVMLAAIGASMMTGCQSDLTQGATHTSTFTLTATSGTVVHNYTITLNVNNH
jgi:Chitobiase/beta-hexosaminidase C-terminal domain